MITIQDLQAVGEDEQARMDFVHQAIQKHKSTADYRTAQIADEYNRRRNRTILQYQKLLYTMSGEAVPDNYSANHKLCSNFFNRFVTQLNQFLLGNGAEWGDEKTGDALGEDFDDVLQDLGEKALVHKVSFGFWNADHLEGFSYLEFAPMWDENDGLLKGGIRFWQIAENKPLMATLYEIDGYTEYAWINGEGQIRQEKRPYQIKVKSTDADGVIAIEGENYPSFPIVPFWGNKYHQSEFVGMQMDIDCYDLIKSGFANDIDDASQIYWIIQNAGGMDDVDMAKFLDRLRRTRTALVDEDGAKAEAHTQDIPYEARKEMLDKLRSDMYDDFMGLDTKNISNGATTATQIMAAYEPLNSKADKYEYNVLQFIGNILALAGIEDKATFTRSMVVNAQETITVILQAAQFLPRDYVTKKILNVLGDGDQAEQILKEMDSEDYERFGGGNNDNNDDDAEVK